MDFVRGSVVKVRLDPVEGSEQGETRPCVVVQNDVANRLSGTVTIVPVVGHVEKLARYPVCVAVDRGIAGLRKASIVNCSHVRTVDRRRIILPALGVLPRDVLERVDLALSMHLGLGW